jgi:selenocysteine lyase/cysteine desulfurase
MSPETYLSDVAEVTRQRTPRALAEDEAFWTRWAREYERDERFAQLNYGYYHPSLRPVLEVELAMARELNRRGAQFKLTETANLLESARAELAQLAGVEREEVVITRNATEALNIVIQGFPLATGDEVVASDQDYDSMTQAWDQRARVDDVRIRRAAIPIDPADDAEVVRAFEAEITGRTRLLHVTHVIHTTGHVLPVAKLCALGKRRGIPVLVDAAHSFAHIDFSIRELDCEFLGTSLHKWLGSPLGTGMLFVRKDRIPTLRPLFGDSRRDPGDIRRLEHFGNRPDSAIAGLREAIRWHRALTTPVKYARLHSLQRSWTERVRAMPRFRLFTPKKPERHGAIGAFALEDAPAEKLCAYLQEKHSLFAAVQKVGAESVVRVTPGLPTSRGEIDRLVAALESATTVF